MVTRLAEIEKSSEIYGVARQLVIKTKPFALKPDLMHPAFYFDKTCARGFSLFTQRKILFINGKKRVDAERIFQVGNKKFLVLLLVVEAEGHELAGLGRDILVEKGEHFFIDEFAEFKDLFYGRAAKVAAVVAERALADGVVIAVKKKAEIRVVNLVTGDECS